MASIDLKNIDLEFEILGFKDKSIKTEIINQIGGIIKTNKRNNISIKALSNINLSIRNTELIGLYGPNGAGKSTLLKLISGIYNETSGYKKIRGSINSFLDLYAGIDFDYTASEVIKFKYFINKPNISLDLFFEKVTELSGLQEYIKLPIRVFSSGMLMRLLFTISISLEKDIILLDEWLSVGDKEFQKFAEHTLNKYLKKSNIVIIASHNLNLLKKICTKIIHLKNGIIVEEEVMKKRILYSI